LAMLAALHPTQVRALWPNRSDFTLRTDVGPRSLTELRAMLVDIRRRGYATENGSITAGRASVAASVLDHNGFPLAAVALTYPVEDVDEAMAAELARRVIDAATAIARQIRGRSNASLIR